MLNKHHIIRTQFLTSRRTRAFQIAVFSIACGSAFSASAVAESITIDDDAQFYEIPVGHSLFIDRVTWLPEANATHTLIAANSSGFGASIQLFKPNGADEWAPGPLGSSFFLAATQAPRKAGVLSLKNSRVDWRDVEIEGEVIASNDAAALAARLGNPAWLDGAANPEAVSITLRDTSKSYEIPAGKRLVTTGAYFHLDSGASTRSIAFTTPTGPVVMGLGANAATAMAEFETEPQNARVARFVADSAANGFDGLTIENDQNADWIDVTISGFLMDEDASSGSGVDDGQGGGVPAALCGDWYTRNVATEIGPNEMTSHILNAKLTIDCANMSYTEEMTGAIIPINPSVPAPQARCAYQAGTVEGHFTFENDQFNFTYRVQSTPDDVECVNPYDGPNTGGSFGPHVHEGGANLTSYTLSNGDASLALRKQIGPTANYFTINYERTQAPVATP